MRHAWRSYLYPGDFSWDSDEALAAAWWSEAAGSKAESLADLPAQDYVEDLLDQGSDLLTSLVHAIAAAAPDDDGLAYVGAGLVEDMVTHWRWATKYLPEVERRARQDPRFRQAVGGVWLGERTLPEVRNRLVPLGAIDITQPGPQGK